MTLISLVICSSCSSISVFWLDAYFNGRALVISVVEMSYLVSEDDRAKLISSKGKLTSSANQIVLEENLSY